MPTPGAFSFPCPAPLLLRPARRRAEPPPDLEKLDRNTQNGTPNSAAAAVSSSDTAGANPNPVVAKIVLSLAPGKPFPLPTLPPTERPASSCSATIACCKVLTSTAISVQSLLGFVNFHLHYSIKAQVPCISKTNMESRSGGNLQPHGLAEGKEDKQTVFKFRVAQLGHQNPATKPTVQVPVRLLNFTIKSFGGTVEVGGHLHLMKMKTSLIRLLTGK
uniref:Uncharacterized protein n=1 Tax=Oryza brachyantha TaxID=4533 RepID=J3N0H1_ORYBR